jgi:3-oxoisoapionate decarboxylase
MKLSRRDLLAASALLALRCEAADNRLRIGVASFSYGFRFGREPALRDPLAFLKFCRERGAEGVQASIPPSADAAAIRRFLDETGAYLEGSVRLPRGADDLERFEADVRAAKAAGATILRTVMLSGRRYETFGTAEEYRAFKESAAKLVALAEPVAARNGVYLAVENHKDLRADEQAELMRKLSSAHVGVTLDTGNNVALLEEPVETAQILAPWVMSVHLKDMAVDAHPDGFLLSEIPVGQGFVDLPKVVAAVRKARPDVRLNIEMITRDPLVVPCLTERYWNTLEALPARVLARMMALVRERKEGRPLPRTAGLSPEQRLALEDDGVKHSIERGKKSEWYIG